MPWASAITCTSMCRPRLDVLLDQHRVVTERCQRLALRRGHRLVVLPRRAHDAHALAAAAGGGLDQHRVAEGLRPRSARRRSTTGRRHAGRHRDLAGGVLAAHLVHHVGGRADQRDAGVLDVRARTRSARRGSRSRGAPRRHRSRARRRRPRRCRGRLGDAGSRRASASRACGADASMSVWIATVWIAEVAGGADRPGGRSRRGWRRARRLSSWPSHPEDAVGRLGDRGMGSGGQAHPEHPAGLERVDDAVVPEPGGRVVRRALVLVLVADRRLERLLVLGRPLVAACASMPSRRTVASTEAACSPPITEIRALGHIHRKRGS